MPQEGAPVDSVLPPAQAAYLRVLCQVLSQLPPSPLIRAVFFQDLSDW